ncbi:hypothetical protein FACS189491_06880 [Spirochaetia bacterium]|nr:hypothetical protein FACS189491_06880 [Spirochaetia bacterium]
MNTYMWLKNYDEKTDSYLENKISVRIFTNNEIPLDTLRRKTDFTKFFITIESDYKINYIKLVSFSIKTDVTAETMVIPIVRIIEMKEPESDSKKHSGTTAITGRDDFSDELDLFWSKQNGKVNSVTLDLRFESDIGGAVETFNVVTKFKASYFSSFAFWDKLMSR